MSEAAVVPKERSLPGVGRAILIAGRLIQTKEQTHVGNR